MGESEPGSLGQAEKTPEINRTFPPWQEENHEKYSPPRSAAIRTSWWARYAGGGLSATNVSLRWSIILSTTG